MAASTCSRFRVPICHGIITGLGGRITVDSEPGRGSLFRGFLPPA